MQFSSLKSIAIHSLFLGSFSLLVSCGGGGGGSSDPAPTNPPASTAASVAASVTASVAASSSSAAALVANAGVDVTVNAGDKISLDPHVLVVNPNSFSAGSGNLEIKGSSTNAADIVGVKWTKVSGPTFSLSTSDTTSGKASFIAPQTGVAASVQVVYKLTITTAGGKTAEANVTFTIKRVNQAPIAKTNGDQTLTDDQTVSLDASTSSDVDGTTLTYAWVQTSGTAVVITNADKAIATFSSPNLTKSATYGFKVTVTDSDGATATANVSVTLTPKNMPVVNIKFPMSGIYNGKTSTAVVVGVSLKNTSALSSITVDAGNGPQALTFSHNDYRLDNFAIPSFTDSLAIKVTVIDSNGLTGEAITTLKMADAQMGVGSTWNGTSALTMNAVTDLLYVITNSGLTSSAASDVKLFSYDLAAKSKTVISDFTDSTKGVSLYPVRAATYGKQSTKIYSVVSTAGANAAQAVISIDTLTGARAIVSDATHGTGVNFTNPTDLVYTPASPARVFVADNGAGSIVTVDVATGNRSLVSSAANENFSTLLALSDGSPILYTAPNYLSNAPFYKANVLDYVTGAASFPGTTLFSIAGSIGTGLDPSAPLKALMADSFKNRAILVDNANRIFGVDNVTGNRTLLFTNDKKITAASYNYLSDLLFITENDGAHQALSAIDLVSGAKVTFAK